MFMSDSITQIASFSTDPSAQAAIQIWSEPKIASYPDCILPESQNCVLQRHDNVSLDDSVLLLEHSLHDLAISLSAQPAATSVQEEQAYISSTLQVILLLVAPKCICLKVLQL